LAVAAVMAAGLVNSAEEKGNIDDFLFDPLIL